MKPLVAFMRGIVFQVRIHLLITPPLSACMSVFTGAPLIPQVCQTDARSTQVQALSSYLHASTLLQTGTRWS